MRVLEMRTIRLRLVWLAASVTLIGALLDCPCPTQASPTPQPGSAAQVHTQHDATVHHSFGDVSHWTAVFDDPSRDAWQKPQAVVQALAIVPGMCVADLGAGTGYFSRYLSTAVGETGTVLAVDTEPNLVVHLRRRAEQEHTANVVPILASPDNPRLPAGAVDLVLIVDTVHHIDDRINYFRRLQRFLKPAGRVAVIDFKKEEIPVGPPLEHKLAPEQVVEEFQAAGYELVAQPDVLPYQYFLVFRSKR
jgi:ubiquinone/menaquinone biosynthesis C-methylase UbiE